MGMKSRRKGRRGEQELVRLLRDHLGDGVARNLQQARDGGHDLLGVAGFAVEVKRAAMPRLAEWWMQTVEQAGQAKPALAYRLDHRPWRVVIALAHLVPDFKGQPLTLEWAVELSLEAFVAVVREFLNAESNQIVSWKDNSR